MPIDYKNYPKFWKLLRKTVLERAQNRCEDCGVKNRKFIYKSDRSYILDGDRLHYNSLLDIGITKGKALKQLGLTEVVLTIAHLDHDASNNDVKIDRLKALCQKCHLALDMPHHINNRKYGRNHLKNQSKLF